MWVAVLGSGIFPANVRAVHLVLSLGIGPPPQHHPQHHDILPSQHHHPPPCPPPLHLPHYHRHPHPPQHHHPHPHPPQHHHPQHHEIIPNIISATSSSSSSSSSPTLSSSSPSSTTTLHYITLSSHPSPHTVWGLLPGCFFGFLAAPIFHVICGIWELEPAILHAICIFIRSATMLLQQWGEATQPAVKALGTFEPTLSKSV